MSRWQPMTTAPRNGTIVEVENNYGIRPSYGLYRWTTEGMAGSNSGPVPYSRSEPTWINVHEPCESFDDEDKRRWRPFLGNPDQYVDPTFGAQATAEYWGGRGGRFEGRGSIFGTQQGSANQQEHRKSWWQRLF